MSHHSMKLSLFVIQIEICIIPGKVLIVEAQKASGKMHANTIGL